MIFLNTYVEYVPTVWYVLFEMKLRPYYICSIIRLLLQIRYSHFYVHTFWVHGPQLFLSGTHIFMFILSECMDPSSFYQVLTFLCSYFLSAWTPALFIQGELVELICDMIYSYEWSIRAFPSVSSSITRCLSYSICSFSVCKLLLCLYIHGSKTHNFIL
jgi:hypothetical protein